MAAIIALFFVWSAPLRIIEPSLHMLRTMHRPSLDREISRCHRRATTCSVSPPHRIGNTTKHSTRPHPHKSGLRLRADRNIYSLVEAKLSYVRPTKRHSNRITCPRCICLQSRLNTLSLPL